jgi:hypothetical protein
LYAGEGLWLLESVDDCDGLAEEVEFGGLGWPVAVMIRKQLLLN